MTDPLIKIIKKARTFPDPNDYYYYCRDIIAKIFEKMVPDTFSPEDYAIIPGRSYGWRTGETTIKFFYFDPVEQRSLFVASFKINLPRKANTVFWTTNLQTGSNDGHVDFTDDTKLCQLIRDMLPWSTAALNCRGKSWED